MTLKEWWEQNQDKEVRISEDGSISITEKKKPGGWKPKRGDIYWVIYGDGDPGAMEWKDGMYDQAHHSIANVFKNKPEAKSAVERMKIRAELLERGGKESFEVPKKPLMVICYDLKKERLSTEWAIPVAGAIGFESWPEAIDAIVEVGEDRIKKYLFGIED